MRTIVTQIIPATETKPAKIRATSEKCSVTISREDPKQKANDTYPKAHIRAVKALFSKYGWTMKRMYGNELGNKIVWVPVNKELRI